MPMGGMGRQTNLCWDLKAIMATNLAGSTFKFMVLREGKIEVVEVGSRAWPQ